MSIEKNDDEEFFQIVWIGNESEQSGVNIDLTNEFTNVDQLKEFLRSAKNCSVIVILSNSLVLPILSPIKYPQICAVYNEELLCLYCLPNQVSVVDTHMKQKQGEKLPEKSTSAVWTFLRKYWFLVGLVVSICLGYFFPNVGKSGGYIRSEWTVKWGCVIFIFLLSGLSLRTRQLVHELLHIRLHLVVQIFSLLIIPFTVYGLSVLLFSRISMNKTLIVGIIIMASTSTTISSNVVMTKNALGNEYAALVNAVLGNILGIFLSPVLIYYLKRNPIFDSFSNTSNTQNRLDYGRVIQNLSLTVLLPLVIGQIIHLLWTKQITRLREKFYFAEVNSLALLTLVWSVFCTAFANRSFEKVRTRDLLILILVDAVIYITFSLIILIVARLPIRYWQFSEKDTVAMMFCGATKTLAMGIPLIHALYGSAEEEIIGILSLPLIIYHAEQLILGALEVILLKSWVQKKSKTLKDKANIESNPDDHLQIEESQTLNVKC